MSGTYVFLEVSDFKDTKVITNSATHFLVHDIEIGGNCFAHCGMIQYMFYLKFDIYKSMSNLNRIFFVWKKFNFDVQLQSCFLTNFFTLSLMASIFLNSRIWAYCSSAETRIPSLSGRSNGNPSSFFLEI